jgi:fructan beta-fructosidase
MPVEGKSETRWVLYGADGAYLLGQFDGRRFTPEQRQARQRVWYGDFYAAQTYSGAPGGRRVQIGWARNVVFPGMPFNQQMTIPVEMTLRPTAEGDRVFARPVAELAPLREKTHAWRGDEIKPGVDPLAGLSGDLFDVRIVAEVGNAGTVTLNVRGTPVIYDAAKRTLTCGKHLAPLAKPDGVISLRVLVDRGSVEAFDNDGWVALSLGVTHPESNHKLGIKTTGERTKVRSVEVDELKSAWR